MQTIIVGETERNMNGNVFTVGKFDMDKLKNTYEFEIWISVLKKEKNIEERFWKSEVILKKLGFYLGFYEKYSKIEFEIQIWNYK